MSIVGSIMAENVESFQSQTKVSGAEPSKDQHIGAAERLSLDEDRAYILWPPEVSAVMVHYIMCHFHHGCVRSEAGVHSSC